MDLTKIASIIEALEGELAAPAPGHFNLTRLVIMGLAEIKDLLGFIHSRIPQAEPQNQGFVLPPGFGNVLCRTNETVASTAGVTVTVVQQDETPPVNVPAQEETPPKVEPNIEIPVASPVTENPNPPATPEAEG